MTSKEIHQYRISETRFNLNRDFHKQLEEITAEVNPKFKEPVYKSNIIRLCLKQMYLNYKEDPAELLASLTAEGFTQIEN